MTYFVLSTTEDGDINLHTFTKKELLEAITPSEEDPRYTDLGDAPLVFLTEVPYLPENPPNHVVVIKGEIIQPKPKEIVTRYSLTDDEDWDDEEG